jgi:esterase
MRLHFKELGDGEPLVMLHGLLGSSDNWFGVAPVLAARFHVFMPDLRNHGNSPHHPEMDYPLLAADVEKFFGDRGLETASVLGHSLGGKVAMQFAVSHPERVKKLVVVDIAPRAYAPSHDKIFSALRALNLETFQTRHQIEEALAPEIPSLTLRRFLLKNLGRNAAGRFQWKVNLRHLAENYPNLCVALAASAPFRGPALFVRGGKSNYISGRDETEIRRLFPAMKMETIEAANHWVPADAPAEFVRRVMGFL